VARTSKASKHNSRNKYFGRRWEAAYVTGQVLAGVLCRQSDTSALPVLIYVQLHNDGSRDWTSSGYIVKLVTTNSINC
jgi:hypothetical protein